MPEQETSPEELQRARGDFVEGAEDDDDISEAAGAADEEVAEADGEGSADDDVVDESPEVSADAEEVEEEEEDEPGAKPDDAIMVPKGRLDEALHKARQREEELQRRLTAAEERKKSETVTADVSAMEQELDELDAKYAELLLEGELEKASSVRKQWRQKQNDMFDIRLEQRSTLASKQAIESMRFDRQLAEYEVKFPVINPDSELFSEEVATEVADLMSAFEAKGWNPVAALNKAVKYVIREEASAAGIDPEVVRAKRSVTARKKVADVARRSPPDITGQGRDTDKVGTGDGLPNVTKMTPEQFAKLSDAQLRKLRGDTLTDQEMSS
jgi:hypothetical protein